MNKTIVQQFQRFGIVLLSVGLLSGCASLPFGKSKKNSKAAASQMAKRPSAPAKKGGIKKFSEVIKKDMAKDEGLFDVYSKDENFFFFIPEDIVGREILVVSRIAKTTTGLGYGGEKTNEQVLRWERKRDKLLLRQVSYRNVAADSLPIYESVKNSNFEPIIETFDIAAHGPDSTGYVIDVSKTFTSDIPSMGLQSYMREALRVRNVDGSRSYVEHIHSYPKNVEVRHVLTYNASRAPSSSDVGAFSLEMNQSMLLLPEEKHTPRIIDNRVRYFGIQQVDFGLDEQRAESRRYAARWKLVPKDKEAYLRGELVEPVEPIVYYIDPATPEKWRPFLKQGVDDWAEAFEAAGFKNAIMAKDPPTKEEDPEFSPEDARYSVIRYFSSDIQNAYGPHVSDPRTGQILESDIGWYHNVMNLLRNWFFVQTAAVNPEARTPKFKDEVMGQLIRFVSSHEVGHTLGLPHNMKASSNYTVAQLRDPAFSRKMGTAPSIMDYARFNYVAQPGDGHVMEDLFPRIGEYDKWSIKWGYTWFPENDPVAEKKKLDAWTKEKIKDPIYHFGNPSREDPTSQTESIGSDNMDASDLGVKNLKVIMDNLMDWAAVEDEGEDYGDLRELFLNIYSQWNRYLGHVLTNVGGVELTYKTWDDEGVQYEMVPAAQQKKAMDYLDRQVFATPTWMFKPELLNRIQAAGILEQVRGAQVRAVNSLIDGARLGRMIEADALYGKEAYAPVAMLDDLRTSIWKELKGGKTIDPFRRNLQRGYLERIENMMTEEPRSFGSGSVDVSQSDIRPLLRDQVTRLKSDIRNNRARFDRVSRAHLEDAIARIDDMLDID
jgi:hypothetical protein